MRARAARAFSLVAGIFTLGGCFALLDFDGFDPDVDEPGTDGAVPTQGSFELLLPDAATIVVAGGEASIVSVRIVRDPGFVDAVTIAAASPPEGLTLTPATIDDGADRVDVAVTATGAFGLGPHVVRLVGASRSIERDAELSIHVVPPPRPDEFGDGGVALFPQVPGCIAALLPRASGGLLAVGTGANGAFLIGVAADGSLDRATLDGGVLALPEELGARPAFLPNGKVALVLLAAGGGVQVLRLLPDGREDPDFGANGRITVPARLVDVTTQSGGRLVGATAVSNDGGAGEDAGTVLRLVRYTAKGEPDPSFASAPIDLPFDISDTSFVNVIAGAADALLLVLRPPSGCMQLMPYGSDGMPGAPRQLCDGFVGTFFGSASRDGTRAAMAVTGNGIEGPRTGVVVTSMSGEADGTFGDGGAISLADNNVVLLATAPSGTAGKWYSVGQMYVGPQTRLFLARWNGDGSVDTGLRDPNRTFGVVRSVEGKTSGAFFSVVEMPDGGVVAGGCVGETAGEQPALFRVVP